MVNATQATESSFITADLVKNSPTKTLTILGEGEYRKTDYGDKLVLPVEIDKKKKEWSINKDSAMNILDVYGEDTKTWLGKNIELKVIRVLGKDSVIGTPKK